MSTCYGNFDMMMIQDHTLPRAVQSYLDPGGIHTTRNAAFRQPQWCALRGRWLLGGGMDGEAVCAEVWHELGAHLLHLSTARGVPRPNG
jgi:hypothetical protein